MDDLGGLLSGLGGASGGGDSGGGEDTTINIVGFAVPEAANVAIGEAFAANGIEISFPQRDIHLDSRTPLQVEVVQQPGKTPA